MVVGVGVGVGVGGGSFVCVWINKWRGASPRRDYVRSEEDGISTNRII